MISRYDAKSISTHSTSQGAKGSDLLAHAKRTGVDINP